MNILHNKEKKVANSDPLMDWLFKAKEFSQKNANVLIGVVVAIVVIISGIGVFRQMQMSSIAKASAAFGNAMMAYNAKENDKSIDLFRIVADNYRNTPQGYQSAYMLGTILFDSDKYDEAQTWYTEASKGGDKADFIAGQALEGIALCYEAKGDIQSALTYLEKALNDNRVKYRHNAIKWKIALLNKSTDVDRTKAICKELVSDTLASEFHQNAENLLVKLETVSGG